MVTLRRIAALLSLLPAVTFAQGTGEVSEVSLQGGSGSVTLDFAIDDYVLVLYPFRTDEQDPSRTFSYTVSGPGVTSKVAAVRIPTDGLTGVTLDESLETDFLIGKTTTVSGTVADPTITRLAFQFN